MKEGRLKPWLWIPASWAHSLSPWVLRWLNIFSEGQPIPWQSRQWKNLVFKNPLGVAGGLDKNAEFLRAWWHLGAGFVEVGTVTPLPQGPNAGKIIQRDTASKALWNKMGFPSHGVEDVYFNLRSFQPYQSPIFINVGKNRSTPLEQAHEDYLVVMNRLVEMADAFVINISSPNTPGLRELQKKENLLRLLNPLVEFCRHNDNKPLLLKLSPDMDPEQFAETLLTAEQAGISGFVLVNTTLSREENIKFPVEGGMSGQPLKARSEKILQETIKILGPKRQGKLIVSVGGILSAEDVKKRLSMGADLVQTYSAMVFEGPHFFKKVAQQFQPKAEKWPSN